MNKASIFILLFLSLPSSVCSQVATPRSSRQLNKRDRESYSSQTLAESLWEAVQALRVRLGIASNYTPSLLHPEICRYISAQECEHVDRNLQRRAHKDAQRSRSLQVPEANPNLGTVKVLVLLVQFTDHTSNRVLIEKSVIEGVWNTEVKRWFHENSQGAYEIEPVVVDWTLTDNTEDYYSFNVQGVIPELEQAMYPILNKLEATPGWDWSQFDADADGLLDAVVMMHSGYDATTPEPDCLGRQPEQRIFSHAFASTEEGWRSTSAGVTLNGYAVSSAYHGICEGEPFQPGLICHELMHTIGLKDLYDTSNVMLAKGLGAYDVMANPHGYNNSGIPGFLSAWSRQVAGWLTPEDITYDGEYVIKPAATSAHAFKILLQDFGFPEYLLIENRQQISFDAGIYGNGLMIYHIDEAADGANDRGYPGQPGWPENGNHYQVAVLPKDRLYDLEQNVNFGDVGDMWLPGDQLTPGMGGTVFPNTDLYQSGIVSESGITVRVVSQQVNGDMIFEVTGLAPAPAGATNLTSPPSGTTSTAAPQNTTAAPGTPTPSIVTTEPVSSIIPATAAVTTANPTTVNPTTANPTTAYPTTLPPTVAPTTSAPTTAGPTTTPGAPSASPTTASPTTASPTARPTTGAPTVAATVQVQASTTVFTANGPQQVSAGCSLFASDVVSLACVLLVVASVLW